MENKEDLVTPPKPALAGDSLNYIKKLQLFINVTKKEIALLLEIESKAASHVHTDLLTEEFIPKITELPHFKDKPNEAKAYVVTLLDHYKNDVSTFIKKADELTRFLHSAEKDLAAIETKYTVSNKNKSQHTLHKVTENI